MSGRGRGGRGGGRGRGRGRRNTRGRNHASTPAKKTGMCPDLGGNVFTCANKDSADKYKTSKNKLVEYLGTTYSQDIATEVDLLKEFIIKQPKHSDATVLAHQAKETQRKRHGERVQKARKSKLAKLATTMKLRDAEDAERAADAAMAHAELENEWRWHKMR